MGGGGGGTRGFYIRLLFRNFQEGLSGGGGLEGFILGGDSLFRNLQEGRLGRGGLDGLVETFTPPLFQVESLVLFRNLQEGSLGGGTRWFCRNLHPPSLSS